MALSGADSYGQQSSYTPFLSPNFLYVGGNATDIWYLGRITIRA